MTHVVENPVDYARNVVGQDPMARLLGIAVEGERGLRPMLRLIGI
jgi:hypothetical protein